MTSRFIFVVCQNGAESVCKSEILENHVGLKFAFSRPGFLTFKVEDNELPEKFVLKSTFSRTYGWSIASLKSEDFAQQRKFVLELENKWRMSEHLHVWQRDSAVPGGRGFEPGDSVLASQIGQDLGDAINETRATDLKINRHAKPDQQVLDVILVEPNHWFIGFHFAATRFQRWPGGTPRIAQNDDAVSRAYFKLLEALLWSGIHIQPGDICAEIGSSPGGACQLLLEKGAQVIAIDPADLDPGIAEHENLTHFKCRGKDVRKKELKHVRWLFTDINVAPNYTLDTVKEIVTNQHVSRIRGMVLTLKLSDFSLAQNIGQWNATIRELGFQVVKTRQLAFNRKEICLFAIKDKYALRSSKQSDGFEVQKTS